MLLIYVPLDIVPIYVNMDKVRLIRPSQLQCIRHRSDVTKAISDFNGAGQLVGPDSISQDPRDVEINWITR